MSSSSSRKIQITTPSEEDAELRRGPWTLEEDNLLIHYIACHGEGHWNLLAKSSGLRRTGKSCRLRWLNYLKPDVKRGNLTPQEQLLILELHSKWGNRWSKIAQHLPGRTDNEIKNYWRTRVQKQARHLKVDSNSTAFRDVVRCLWMPRLYQKIEKPSYSSAMIPQNPAMPLPLDHSSHNSESQPAPLPPQTLQVPAAQMPLSMRETIHSLKNSSSNNCTSSPTSSCVESVNNNTSQIPQISEYPTAPFHAPSTATGNSDYYNNAFLKDGYYVENSSYEMGNFSLASISAEPVVEFDNLMCGSNILVPESNWVDNDLADSLWMDELWQYRQFQERGT